MNKNNRNAYLPIVLLFIILGVVIFVTRALLEKNGVDAMFLLWANLFLFILSIGLSRVYFGFHYPTDVLAGWFMGGSYLLFLIAGYNLVTASLDYYEKP